MARMPRFLVCCLLAGCSRAGEEAQETAAALEAAGGPVQSEDSVCKLFSASDAARYIGEPAAVGEPSAGGCQWGAADGSGDMIVAIVPARYHEPPKGSPGYKTLTGVGSKGFVSPYLDGWRSGAIVGEEALRVSVAGDGASEATAVALLKDAIERRR